MLPTFLTRVDFQHQLNQQDGLHSPLVGESNQVLGFRVDIQDCSTSYTHLTQLVIGWNMQEKRGEDGAITVTYDDSMIP